MPVAPGIAQRRRSSRIPTEAPIEVEFVELVRQVWAAVASAGQVRSWRVSRTWELRGLPQANTFGPA